LSIISDMGSTGYFLFGYAYLRVVSFSVFISSLVCVFFFCSDDVIRYLSVSSSLLVEVNLGRSWPDPPP